MLFNSYVYIFLFLPVTFFVYFYLNTIRQNTLAKAFLLAASLFFYSWWNVKYLPLILVSMSFNYCVGVLLIKKNRLWLFSRKHLLALGVSGNMALLAYFKYSNFFIDNVNALFGTGLVLLQLALPLAISFFTFQQIVYLVDLYRHEAREKNFLDYAVFVSFFPQLIAGPIVHHHEMMSQFTNKRNWIKNYQNIFTGLFIFSIGLFKKVIIADTFAAYAITGFDKATTLTLIEAWVTSLSYTFQLYFDFSGYTDMAIGAALLFNIRLPRNFNSPYKACDIQDFWRRWHMTLSRFLKDCVYVPLGGNRSGTSRACLNIMATFLVGGIWHGAGWTFVFWGALHGMAVIIHRLWRQSGYRLNAVVAWFMTFNFVNLSWVFFRAESWDSALKVLSGMFGLNGVVLPGFLAKGLPFLSDMQIQPVSFIGHLGSEQLLPVWLVAVLIAALCLKNTTLAATTSVPITRSAALLGGFAFTVAVLSMTKASVFLYFNF